MANKQIVKIADLAQLSHPVDISDDQQIMVRALNLREMMTLFVESRDLFLPLYMAGLDGKVSVEQLAPFLLTAPDVVARIIAMASDDPTSAPVVENNMPATVQLIALSEIWKASVPDKKKAAALFSEVVAMLQKLQEKGDLVAKEQQTISSPTILQPQ